MKKLTTTEIRQMWIDFYESKGHYIEPGKSLIPFEDETLLFINSGVATLKKYFDGSEIPPSKRLANAQRSIRTNDIENVGITSRHHTLFEMLGNFSIGDYFKSEAIEWAFELLTSPKWFDIDIEKLYFTVHPDDQESINKWLELGVNPNKIVKLEENFWEIGQGPGGPNTEIFYDRGESFDSRNVYDLLAEDLENDRIIEIWNIVFSQYNCNPGVLLQSEYEELPQKNIDTGMGLERMACVMQEVETNFETDNFIAIINQLVEKTNIKYEDEKMSYRVIADHIRALVFAISDGALPSNDGRGYVIRRILRRAVRFGYKNLDQKRPFLAELVDVVVLQMKDFYPYLVGNIDYIKEIITNEEIKFFNTLEDGLKLLNREIKKVDNGKLDASIAFKLYDTYGFPIELTQEVLEEQGLIVDIDEFNSYLEEQRNRARLAINKTDSMNLQNSYIQEINIESKFIGYQTFACESEIVLLTNLHEDIEEICEGQVYILLKETPFYAESGGQVSDLGFINGNKVLDVKKAYNGQHLHLVEVVNKLQIGQTVKAEIDLSRRTAITKNHSATHLLHLALHQVVGNHAQQAGSLQDEKKTRFDFSNLTGLSNSQLIELNEKINIQINDAHQVNIKTMSIKEAKEVGAQALFGEKYGDVVRVVTMGDSIELCGGTHVSNTKEIECFQIVSEVGIGSGIRRIEAVTGENVLLYEEELTSKFDELVEKILKDHQNEVFVNLKEFELVMEKVRLLYRKKPELEKIYDEIVSQNEKMKKLSQLKKSQKSIDIVTKLIAQAEKEDDINKIEAELNDVSVKELKQICDEITNQLESVVIILKAKEEDKVSVVVKISDNLVDKYDAGNIVKEIVSPFNGRGGGRKNMAQGGYQL